MRKSKRSRASLISLGDRLFGYVILSIEPQNAVRLVNRAIELGISIKEIKSGEFAVGSRNAERLTSVLDFEYRARRGRGLFSLASFARRRPGFLLGAVLSLVVYALLFGTVWDVRIEECEGVDVSTVEDRLNTLGLRAGVPWAHIDLGDTEGRLLSDCGDLSWVSIDRRGTVAYVSVLPKAQVSSPKEYTGYSNVIAAVDCVIEEVTVKCGVAAVKVGDSVRAGDVLISGILPAEQGGGFCYARGEVIGRYSDSFSVSVPKTVSERKTVKREQVSINLNIFAFSLKIFERYGNFDSEYAIIEKTNGFKAENGAELPFSMTRKYVEYYEWVERTRDQKELCDTARELMGAAIANGLSASELLRAKSRAEFIGDSYVMTTDVIARGQVGRDLNFEYKTETK